MLFREFTLTLFSQKFRKHNVFTKEVTKEPKELNFFKYSFRESKFLIFKHCENSNLDTIYSFFANMFPWLIRVHELSIFNLIFNIYRVCKWKLARQGHIYDNSCWPNVQSSIEPTFLQYSWVQNFRGKVCWCTNNWFSKRFFPDDFSIPKVTEFYLFWKTSSKYIQLGKH